MSKNKAFYATLEPFTKKKVIYLQPYFYQGDKWYPVKLKNSNVKTKKDK